MSTVTNGIGCISRVAITSSAPTLILVGSSALTTYQITSEATDNFGNVIPDVPFFYDIVAGNDLATVSDSGLVTATGAGEIVLQVSASAFGATPAIFTPAGLPASGVVYAEQAVTVLEGDPSTLYPNFDFSIDSPSGYTLGPNGTITITVTQVSKNSFNGTTSYGLLTNYGSIYPWKPHFPPNYPCPILGGQFYTPFGSFAPVNVKVVRSGNIAGGSGTMTFTLTSQNAPPGVVPIVIGGSYPVWAATTEQQGNGVGRIVHNISTTLTVTS